MNIHLLEHETEGISTNILAWTKARRHTLSRTQVPNADLLPEVNDFDMLIVAGGPQHLWEKEKNPWVDDEKRLIAATAAGEKKIMGICLVAQLLAEVLGGEVFPCPLAELGWHDVHLTVDGTASPLFRGVPKRFAMFQWHSDHFTLPAGATRLATSEAARNQAFASPNGRMLGIQFHPDFDCDLIMRMVGDEAEKWPEGPFVTPRKALLQETADMEEPAWLMDILLDNLAANS